MLRQNGKIFCLILAGVMVAICVRPALAVIAEDNWQSLEHWEQEATATVNTAPDQPAEKLLPSLGQNQSASSSKRAASTPHEVDFAGLPPLFDRPRSTVTVETKQPILKAPIAKEMTVSADRNLLIGRENERRSLALTLPGIEKAPTVTDAAAACAKPKLPALDQRLVSDRATLAALQNAVKSVGAEEAFDLMLPQPNQKKSLPASAPEIVRPEVKPLALIALP